MKRLLLVGVLVPVVIVASGCAGSSGSGSGTLSAGVPAVAANVPSSVQPVTPTSTPATSSSAPASSPAPPPPGGTDLQDAQQACATFAQSVRPVVEQAVAQDDLAVALQLVDAAGTQLGAPWAQVVNPADLAAGTYPGLQSAVETLGEDIIQANPGNDLTQLDTAAAAVTAACAAIGQ